MQRAIKRQLQVGKVIEIILLLLPVIAIIIAVYRTILIVAVSAVILITGFLNTGLPKDHIPFENFYL